MTQKDLARKCGLFDVSIHAYKNGSRPRYETAKKIVDATDGLISFQELGWNENLITGYKKKLARKVARRINDHNRDTRDTDCSEKAQDGYFPWISKDI